VASRPTVRLRPKTRFDQNGVEVLGASERAAARATRSPDRPVRAGDLGEVGAYRGAVGRLGISVDDEALAEDGLELGEPRPRPAARARLTRSPPAS
jgi:hypothetical protein